MPRRIYQSSSDDLVEFGLNVSAPTVAGPDRTTENEVADLKTERPTHWVTANKQSIAIYEMGNVHLMNSVRLLEKEGLRTLLSRDRTAMHSALMFEVNLRQLPIDRWCVTCQNYHAVRENRCQFIYCTACKRRHPDPVSREHADQIGCVKA